MRTVYFVSGNKHKAEELALLLKASGVEVVHKNLKVIEPDLDSIKATALAKAEQAYAKLKKPVLTEDTGLYFQAYRNFPGPNPRKVFEELGFEGIFKLLKGKSRKAVFKTVLCLMESPRKVRFFEGRMKGRITTKVYPPIKRKFPYDNIFIPEGKNKPIIKLALAEKNMLSHRGQAASKIAKQF